MRVTAYAPAKVNLYLHVTGWRADGYHLVDSLVAFADIGDRLTAEPACSLSLAVDGPEATDLPAIGIAVMYRGSICELGSARDVLYSPRHPYTQALLAAVPQLRAHGFPAAALPAGGIPSAAEDAGAGCRFKARYPHKIDGLCETVAPPLRRLSLTHHVACHLDAPSG